MGASHSTRTTRNIDFPSRSCAKRTTSLSIVRSPRQPVPRRFTGLFVRFGREKQAAVKPFHAIKASPELCAVGRARVGLRRNALGPTQELVLASGAAR